MAKKTIVAVGWGLVGFILVAYAAVMLIATFSGKGTFPVKLIPGGRGGSQFLIAVIPLLLGLLAVAIFWLRRVFRRRASATSPDKAPNSDAQKPRAG